MVKKPKFRPKMSRIKLNPEQAVLTCDCYTSSGKLRPAGHGEYGCTLIAGNMICMAGEKSYGSTSHPCTWGSLYHHEPNASNS